MINEKSHDYCIIAIKWKCNIHETEIEILICYLVTEDVPLMDTKPLKYRRVRFTKIFT